MANVQIIARLFSKLILFGIITYIPFIYFTSGSGHSQDEKQPSTSERNDLQSSPERKIILFDSNWWHAHYPFLDETKTMCPQCTFTEDKKMWELSDTVVFHGVTVNKSPPINKRTKDQIWVWLMFETTDYVGSSVKKTAKYTDMFNWTMTYRYDSDVVVPYGRFVSFDEIPLPKYEETWAFLPSALPDKNGIYDDTFMKVPSFEDIKERRMAAWIVSHCHSGSKRESVVKELQKHIDVDIYGNCGNFTCDVPRSKSMSGIDCRFQISRKYKFYLSFENSLCEDYVTEKYFDVLYTQMVPVVYGSANYSRLAPNNSYINVMDFKDIEELATYLKYLDSNPVEYLKYFEWRKSYWVQNNRFVTGYCDLCKKLWNYDKTTPRFYHNLTDWWYHRSDFNTSGLNACAKPNRTYLRKPI